LAKQRIAIEEKATVEFGGSGTFKLIPLTGGPVKADAGTLTFTGAFRGIRIQGGQEVKTYAGVDTLKGKHGTLRIKATNTKTDSGFGYSGGVSTWSIAEGTGAYGGLTGGGRGTVVGTPSLTVIGRYEGYVTAP
jgi:hypothetical protein